MNGRTARRLRRLALAMLPAPPGGSDPAKTVRARRRLYRNLKRLYTWQHGRLSPRKGT